MNNAECLLYLPKGWWKHRINTESVGQYVVECFTISDLLVKQCLHLNIFR